MMFEFAGISNLLQHLLPVCRANTAPMRANEGSTTHHDQTLVLLYASEASLRKVAALQG